MVTVLALLSIFRLQVDTRRGTEEKVHVETTVVLMLCRCHESGAPELIPDVDVCATKQKLVDGSSMLPRVEKSGMPSGSKVHQAPLCTYVKAARRERHSVGVG